ncbi:MAG TPA: HEPN domain-containing protein [Candidatus Goldiibacteriota bacterium]|nr:HEPN domain-containing protein [Candidatus Goldiibacteriota bacterium]HPN63945.1 HEPN domain-containing protein [Candidatus Goldiibacteriota bacterium]HRQ44061.1 HEPN domain-containing protein [Candidatus Goldiibacteriota bacterium]
MMTHRIRTQETDRNLYVVFLEKAEQFLTAAKQMHESDNFNASAANSVHACISAADALCAWHLGKRAAGEKHSDAVNLVKSIKNTEEFLNNGARFSRALAVKSLAEYEARLVFKKDSESVLSAAGKFLEFAVRNLPKR